MNGHWKQVCVNKKCKAIVAQCRCPGENKTEEMGVCNTCRTLWIMDKCKSKEVEKFLTQVHPDENSAEN